MSPPLISVCDTAEGQNNQLAVAMLNIGLVLVEKTVSVIIFMAVMFWHDMLLEEHLIFLMSQHTAQPSGAE